LTRKQITTTLDEDILTALRVYSAENYTDVNKVLEDASKLWLTLKNEKSSFKDILNNFPINEGSEETKIVGRYLQIQAEQESR